MTWEQYQDWQSAMRDHLAKRTEERRLLGGNGVIVNGLMLSVQPTPARERRVIVPTWELTVFGRVQATVGGETQDWTPWERAAWVSNATGEFNSTNFWGLTQLYTTEAEEPVARTFTMELQVLGVEPADTASIPTDPETGALPLMEASAYKYAVRLLMGEFQNEGVEGEMLRDFNIDLRHTIVSGSYASQFSGITELRPTGIVRI